MTLSISLNFLPLMEITQLRSRLSETFSMSTHDDLLNGATQKDRKCVAFVSSHRVSQFCLLLFVALSLFQGCSGSMLPFTAPRGTLWLGSARNNPQRFAAAKLKWLNALQGNVMISMLRHYPFLKAKSEVSELHSTNFVI